MRKFFYVLFIMEIPKYVLVMGIILVMLYWCLFCRNPSDSDLAFTKKDLEPTIPVCDDCGQPTDKPLRQLVEGPKVRLCDNCYAKLVADIESDNK